MKSSLETGKKRSRKLTIALTLAMIICLTLSGCSGGGTTNPTSPVATTTAAAETQNPGAEDTELYILAAASLTDVLSEIGEAYKAVAPHVTLTFVFDSSGTLQTQIEEGAPADVFLSAAQKQMNTLSDGGLIIKESRKDMLINKVVLIVPENSDKGITSFEEAATDMVSMIAIGDETVPVGQYAREIFTNLGIWEQIEPKANLGANVRAVLAWVESGDVDCGVVYATDAAVSDGVRVICEAPDGSHAPVIYPGALVGSTTNQAEAQAFLDYLSSPTAAALFEAAGFSMA